MSITHWTQWKSNAGQISDWLDTDSQELWQKNMSDPERRRQLTQTGWDKPDAIQYRFNSDGFRCDEFDQSLCLMSLGCSFTGGVGLREQDIWCSKLAHILDLKLANLGVGGASFDTVVRLLNYWLPRLNVGLVAILEPPPARFEVFLNDIPQVFAPLFNNKPFDLFKKLWYLQPENTLVNVWKNRLVVQQLCQQHSVPVAMIDFVAGLGGYQSGYQWNTARDMMHYGAENHTWCAEQFQNHIRKHNLL